MFRGVVRSMRSNRAGIHPKRALGCRRIVSIGSTSGIMPQLTVLDHHQQQVRCCGEEHQQQAPNTLLWQRRFCATGGSRGSSGEGTATVRHVQWQQRCYSSGSSNNSGTGRQRSLHDMLRQFKLAGAHPDIIMPHDAAKAHDNSEALIELESYINCTCGYSGGGATAMGQGSSTSCGGGGGRSNPGERQGVHRTFWLLDRKTRRLQPVKCKLDAKLSDQGVYTALKQLFAAAGLRESFVMPRIGAQHRLDDSSFASILRTGADAVAAGDRAVGGSMDHLYVDTEHSIARLREFGVMVILLETPEGEQSSSGASGDQGAATGGTPYLLTMPQLGLDSLRNPAMLSPRMSQAQFVKQQGELDPDVSKYLEDRCWMPFNVRYITTAASLEALHRAVATLRRLFDTNRGTIVRGGVTFVIPTGRAARSEACHVAGDGCFVLPLHQVHEWENFLVTTPVPVWIEAQKLQADWRGPHPTLLFERKKRLARHADAFNVSKLSVDVVAGRPQQWAQRLLNEVGKNESVIRSAVKKYRPSLGSPENKKVLRIHFKADLWSPTVAGKRLDYLLDSSGTFHFNAATVASSIPKVLKCLKDNQAVAVRRARNKVEADGLLRYVQSAVSPLTLGLDKNWCQRDPDSISKALQCLTMLKANIQLVRGVVAHVSMGQANKVSTILVSDHASVAAGGVVTIPWNTTAQKLQEGGLLA